MSQNDRFSSFGEKMFGMLRSGASAAVCGHVNPDGDSVAACFAMALALRRMGVLPLIIVESFNERYNFLSGGEFIYSGGVEELAVDCCIALDCASPDRLGAALPLFQNTELTFVIDHHISNTGFGKYNLIAESVSSTCELLYLTMNKAVSLDLPILNALFTGIVFDTGGFRHPNASWETFLIVSEMVRAGVNSSEIQRRAMEVHSEKEARIFAKAIGTLEVTGNIGICGITNREMRELGCSASDLDGIVDYVLKTDGVEIAVFLSERTEGVIKVSLRSLRHDICKIAVSMGGGGHLLAAGANLEGSLASAKDKVLELIGKGVK